MNYRPWHKSVFRMIYGTAFRAPNTYELNYAGEGMAAAHSLGNEEIKAFEGDWEQELTGPLSLSAAIDTGPLPPNPVGRFGIIQVLED